MNVTKKWLAILLATLLFIVIAGPTHTNAATISDVKTTDSKYKAINWVVDQKIMKLHKGQFIPRTTVTEIQFLEMIASLDEAYIYSKTPDLLVNHYGSDLNIPLMALQKRVYRQNAITRGQFAIYYAALTGLDLSEKQAIQNLYRLGLSVGTTGKRTYEDFQANRVLNREDLAMFFYRINEIGGLKIKGLNSKASGKDNAQITLPLNFVGTDGTVTLPDPTSENVNDASNHPTTFKAVQSISVAKNELIANGVDSTLVKIQLKDGYGNTIPQNESLQFKVTSQVGASVSTTGNNKSNKLDVVKTDGGELAVYVTAPTLSKSMKDTISFQLINNNQAKYAAYKNQTIDVTIRYVPQAELRISYEVFDPTQVDWKGGNVDEGVKPLAPLPTAQTPEDNSLLITLTPDNGKINITDIDLEYHTFSGTKIETYEYVGVKQTQEVEVIDAMYENANLKFNGYDISLWLFEKIISTRYEEGYNPEVSYTIDASGNPTYSIPSTIAPNFNEYNDMTDAMATVKYLVDTFIPDRTNQIFSYHYDTVMALKTIYDTKFSEKDKNDFLRYYSKTLAKLNAAYSAVTDLKEKEELDQRPSDMDRYTKVMVSLVAPGGQVITDFKGQVEIEYNGKKYLANFTTNTTSFYPDTGHGGVAVVYFDDIIYGYSTAKATIKNTMMDSRYNSILKDIVNVTKDQTIFTNYKFEERSCSRQVEVAYVLDQSLSMHKLDPTNYIATKTKQLMREIPSENTIAVEVTTDASVVAKGKSTNVVEQSSLFTYTNEDDDATDLSKGLNVALTNFSSLNSTSKAIILVSDGKTTTNQIQSMVTKAKQQNVKIYTVAVGGVNDTNLTLMKQLAAETGGAFFQVTKVEDLHGSYQSILNSILCGDEAKDLSCANTTTLFEDANVQITRTVVSMSGTIKANCQVAKVETRFIADHGDITFALHDRGQNVYNLSKAIKTFQDFDLYNEVEFLAYDTAGNVIGTKQVRVQ